MGHGADLLSTIAVGLTAAFIGGMVARKLRLPVIVGYLVGGMAVGPFTPGLVADVESATELAELGVVLLMFGVGIHFSPRDLFTVRRTAVPGAIGQILVATLLGVGLGWALGWSLAAGLVLGLAISIASTVVLLRALESHGSLHTRHGRIAVGWLIVEDLFTVVVLVLLPVLAPALLGEGAVEPSQVLTSVGWALLKTVALAAGLLVIGSRVVPWILSHVASEGRGEMFTLGVLTIAIGVAYAASAIFGLSFALGAFLAGAAVGESDLSHDAAEDALPFRDAFSVLFFVSVGMLLDPGILVTQTWAVLGALLIIVVGKSMTALLIVLALKRPLKTGLIVAAGLAQIGEFSFILAQMGMGLELLPPDGFQVVVAAAVVSITLNPLLFWLADRIMDRRGGHISADPVPA
jgi:CPA2 family monovalent cation:H+ antiporter-2